MQLKNLFGSAAVLALVTHAAIAVPISMRPDEVRVFFFFFVQVYIYIYMSEWDLRDNRGRWKQDMISF